MQPCFCWGMLQPGFVSKLFRLKVAAETKERNFNIEITVLVEDYEEGVNLAGPILRGNYDLILRKCLKISF